MFHEKIVRLITKKLAGEATKEELAQLDALLRKHPEEQFLADIIYTYWLKKQNIQEDNISEQEIHFKSILNKAEGYELQDKPELLKNFQIRYQFSRLLVAAVCAVILGLSVYFFYNSKITPVSKSNAIIRITTTYGNRSQLLLPDGSKVWLNAGSKLDYDKDFDKPLREVYLDGEAYFDVVKHAKRPFIIHTSVIDIKVLGTSFNVSAYTSDSTVITTLIRGLIEIINKKNPQSGKIILHPNQKYLYTPAANAMQQESVKDYIIQPININPTDSIITETAWTHNRLQFDGDSFKELAEKLERWFNIEIEITSTEVAQYRLSGTFEDETIQQVLDALKLITPFKYTIHGNKIKITK